MTRGACPCPGAGGGLRPWSVQTAGETLTVTQLQALRLLQPQVLLRAQPQLQQQPRLLQLRLLPPTREIIAR